MRLNKILPFFMGLGLTLNVFAQSFVHEASKNYRWPDDEKVVEKLKKWQDLKFGIILHWGVYSVPGMVESWQITSEDWITPDTTRTYEEEKFYSVMNSGFKGNPKNDVLKYIMDAYRAEGLMPGLYFSKPDWHSEYYWWPVKATPNRFHNYKIEDYPERWAKYQQYVYDQSYELMHNYGDIDLFWLDGGWCTAPREDIKLGEIVKMAREAQPGLIVVERACPGEFENYQTPEQTIPDHQINNPWESCITLTYDWGWTKHPVFKSAGKVISILSEIVAKGGSLLLGVGPSPEGLIEDGAVEKLEEIGAWLRFNGEAIYSTVTTPIYQNEAKTVFFTANKDGKTLYAIVPRDDKNGIPATIEWTGNAPKKGSKLINLATKKSLKWKTVGDKTTVILPANAAETNGVAIKFSVK